MRKKIYGRCSRYLLIQYEDGKETIIHTRKPYNDKNEFPEHTCKPVKCEDVSNFLNLVDKIAVRCMMIIRKIHHHKKVGN